jgi:hypothetical protein
MVGKTYQGWRIFRNNDEFMPITYRSSEMIESKR